LRLTSRRGSRVGPRFAPNNRARFIRLVGIFFAGFHVKRVGFVVDFWRAALFFCGVAHLSETNLRAGVVSGKDRRGKDRRKRKLRDKAASSKCHLFFLPNGSSGRLIFQKERAAQSLRNDASLSISSKLTRSLSENDYLPNIALAPTAPRYFLTVNIDGGKSF
jgi:hypothetical protein